MKQVVVIHGGGVHSSYEEYLQYLKDYEIKASDLERGKGWKEILQNSLGADYQILAPQMPNRENAKYPEWKLWFEKHLPYINDGVILAGHSLGGIFLAKYLAEEKFPKEIAATFLIAPPFDMRAEFVAPSSFALLAQQGGKIFLFHSEDDPVVPFSELAKYQAALPAATARVFHDRAHFNQEEFPELVADIRSL